MNTPKVSVIITTHNRPELLSRALCSVLTQTFKEFEILVIDDSQDSSIRNQNWMVMDKYDDNRIKYILNQHKKGVSGARNTGILNSQGDYISFLDDDDIFSDPSKLKKQFDLLSENFKLGIVGTNFQLTNSSGDIIRQIKQPETHKGICDSINIGGGICFGSSMIKKLIIDAIGGFDEDLSYGEDINLIYSILKRSEGFNIQEYMLNYTQWGGNSINSISLPRLKGFNVLRKNGKEFPNYYKGLLWSGAHIFVPSFIRHTGIGSKIAKLVL